MSYILDQYTRAEEIQSKLVQVAIRELESGAHPTSVWIALMNLMERLMATGPPDAPAEFKVVRLAIQLALASIHAEMEEERKVIANRN